MPLRAALASSPPVASFGRINCVVLVVLALFRYLHEVTKTRAVPTPPNEEETALREELRKKTRSPVFRWMWSTGWKFVLVYVVVVGFGISALGVPDTFELLLGLTSPSGIHVATWQEQLTARSTAFAGWLAIPAIVGGVAGYVVSAQMTAFRDRSIDDIRYPGAEG